MKSASRLSKPFRRRREHDGVARVAAVETNNVTLEVDAVKAQEKAAAPVADVERGTHDLTDLLGLSSMLSSHDVLRNALLVPISKLKQCRPEQLRELTFVQATIFACLELNQYRAIEKLAEELKKGTAQLDRANRRFNAAAGDIQTTWRQGIARKGTENARFLATCQK